MVVPPLPSLDCEEAPLLPLCCSFFNILASLYGSAAATLSKLGCHVRAFLSPRFGAELLLASLGYVLFLLDEDDDTEYFEPRGACVEFREMVVVG